MKTAMAVFAGVFTWVALLGAPARQETASGPSSCAVVQQALSDYQHIKAGATRREVEKYFVLDGGLQFRSKTTYAYPKCNYIKLEIEFSPAPSGAPVLLSPDDTVTKVSKLFVGYPAKD
jgi:predicted membrane-bound spermidine synthase